MKIQGHLEDLTFGSELRDGSRVVDALLLMRVMDLETGQVTFMSTLTEGTDDIIAAGLISVARTLANNSWREIDDEENE